MSQGTTTIFALSFSYFSSENLNSFSLFQRDKRFTLAIQFAKASTLIQSFIIPDLNKRFEYKWCQSLQFSKVISNCLSLVTKLQEKIVMYPRPSN